MSKVGSDVESTSSGMPWRCLCAADSVRVDGSRTATLGQQQCVADRQTGSRGRWFYFRGQRVRLSGGQFSPHGEGAARAGQLLPATAQHARRCSMVRSALVNCLWHGRHRLRRRAKRSTRFSHRLALLQQSVRGKATHGVPRKRDDTADCAGNAGPRRSVPIDAGAVESQSGSPAARRRPQVYGCGSCRA